MDVHFIYPHAVIVVITAVVVVVVVVVAVAIVAAFNEAAATAVTGIGILSMYDLVIGTSYYALG